MTSAAPSVARERPAKPYPGLRPFEEHEWSIFFGRERMVEDVIDRLAENRLVLIHGASGSGKSSLVRAGVMPKLERQFRRHGAPWLTCAMRPAGGPLWNLAAELARLEGNADVARIGAIASAFNRHDASLADIASGLDALRGQSLCILVDQFEELFRFEKETSREEAELFVELIVRATREAVRSGADVHVVVTMRSEFLGQCARFDGLAETINKTQYLVPRIDEDALLRAVRRPAQLFGGVVDEDLAYRLIAGVRGREDELPLLQHGLMLMWDEAADERTPNGRIVLDGTMVEKAGGLAALLSDHADRVMASVAPDARREKIVEMVFRALTDVNAEGAAIRRPQRCAELAAVAGTTVEELRPILDAFRAPGVSFLTPYAPEPVGESTIVDISHEALIRCWRRISEGRDGWLKREFDDGLAWRSLVSEAEAFETNPERVLSPATTKDRSALVASRNDLWSQRYGGGWPSVGKLLAASRRSAADARRKSWIAAGALAGLTVGAVVFACLSLYEMQSSETQKTNSIRRGEIARLIIEDKIGIKSVNFEEKNGDSEIKNGINSIFKNRNTDTKSIVFFKIKSMSGRKDYRSNYMLGLMYYSGYGTSKNFSEAFNYIKESADAAYKPAVSAVAMLYANGQGVPLDYDKAREWYEKAAAAGDATAMREVAFLYYNGQGVPQDYGKVLEWFEKAAAAGDATSMTNVGVIYANARGVPRDYGKAREWFEKGAAVGDTRAMLDIGLLYFKGQGVPQSYGKTREWFEKGAALGDATAMRSVGILHSDGLGVPQDYGKARKWYEKAIAAGDTIAMAALGDLYKSGGPGVPRDYAKAREWYEKAAAAGDTSAMTSIGFFYEYGQGTPRDYAKAREWYEKADAAGNATATNNIGVLYENGRGVPRDYGKAREWYEKAAAAGETVAMRNVGNLYENGRGVPRDYTKAREWYEKAANAHDATAIRAIGVLYAGGKGVPRDYGKAREWYEKAAAAGDAVAMRYIGLFYSTGLSVPRDYGKAREWFEKAIAGGDTTALQDVGLLYQDGLGVPRDYGKAREWFEKAVAAGNATAMLYVGDLYKNGQGVPQDYGTAREWYEKAIAAGDAAAMTAIGMLCENGRGVTQDYGKAREWYEKAAAAGDATAMTNLGVLYYDGQGVPRDYGRAREWFEKGAALGDAVAMRDVGVLYKNGQSVPQDYGKAREWYEKAAAAGGASGMRDLGGLYRNGQGVPQDYGKAREWYEKAAAAGDAAAMSSLGSLYFHGQGVPQNYGKAREWYATSAAAGNKDAFLSVSWMDLFLRDFSGSLVASEKAHEAQPDSLESQGNRAEALMFLGRVDEARAIYMAHLDKVLPDQDNKTWQQVILDDFAELRKAGLDHPLMKEIEAAFAAHKT